ncbi:CRISPR-associated helicase/endonuclease Cas3 [Heyndrickxia sporothermodurans]|uniref:Uncharacterized protein n=1 Tax=Heyndrickxia sporothermodurans TaxID=46224 RepID=A0A150LDC3_9BACI|nr:CRISPR-associated helicase/endonuclease Cas3 [Heyndrickxia sporothermodurans]KYD09966.1 hypothetical protein B4102_2379 [Heyndrickxia sporothermodurans]MED3779298.1 CRISPR-associated helicase/endonuclease Cas3 [Heyndrickxia sporothermodurans]PTY77971.1 CRISPR-associated helicase/endonuclease Cas3 [Heyndrickxia sporothermodurans]
MIYYAKSDPVETIKEHTDQLLIRYETLKSLYKHVLPLSERDWEILKIAVEYHDVGKTDIVFQNKIRKKLNKPLLEAKANYQVEHNFLSVIAIPFQDFAISGEEGRLLSQVIAFHHERGSEPKFSEIEKNYKLNILPYRDVIKKELHIVIDEKIRLSKLYFIKHQKRILPIDGILFKRYVLLKGLLHRLDHAASAHVPIELANEMDIGVYVQSFIQKTFPLGINELQKFTKDHQKEHVVVIAQTGMGKTEAGLLWLGNRKGFFTLPLRVSINSMYQRIVDSTKIAISKRNEEYGEMATGLLHSTSLDYLYDQEEANDQVLEKVHSQSKEFANKLIITTIDQILKFPFYYLGFEKEIATVATAKVIVDELQAYNPRIAAMLIRAMVIIDQFGGSFMIMTATLPDFYFKALQREMKDPRTPIAYKSFIDDSKKRHNIKIEDLSIIDSTIIDKAVKEGEVRKVIIICNTIKRAREVYQSIFEKNKNVCLLHSKFTKKDRNKLEDNLLLFAENHNTPGIWITTQIVEASLDIDFDFLITEMSSLDSQFQRYGRCNRKGKKSISEPNILVCMKDVSGIGNVYYDEIYSRSCTILNQQGEGVILESTKQMMIYELYNEESLSGTKFKKEFDDTLKQLRDRPLYEIRKSKAQDLLRDIQQVQAIPIRYKDCADIKDAFIKWQQASTKTEKRKARYIIEQFTVPVNLYSKKNRGLLSDFPLIKGLYYIDREYSEQIGLV